MGAVLQKLKQEERSENNLKSTFSFGKNQLNHWGFATNNIPYNCGPEVSQDVAQYQ